MALVELADAKLNIGVTDDQADVLLEMKLAQAEEAVLDYLKQRRSDGDTWEATVDAWTIDDVPARVQAAILNHFTYLWRYRGDEVAPALVDGLAPGTAAMLARLRDPAVA